MELLRTVVALAILLVWFGVIIEGAIRGDYRGPVAAMMPVVTFAAAYLLGRDAIEAALERRAQTKRREATADETE